MTFRRKLVIAWAIIVASICAATGFADARMMWSGPYGWGIGRNWIGGGYYSQNYGYGFRPGGSFGRCYVPRRCGW